MAVQGVNGLAVATAAAGALLAWSGFKGAKVTTALRSLLSGQQPSGANTEPVTSPTAPTVGLTGSNATGGLPQGGTSVTPAGPGESAWILAFLTSIGAPPTPANIHTVTAWIQHETPWPPVARNNPLNTTLQEPGSSPYNSVGVQNYPDPATGILATSSTIREGGYGDILLALRSGQGLCGRSWAGLSRWSGGGYSSVC